MGKRGVISILLILSIFILGCNSSIIEENKGLLHYSIKGCINKQSGITKSFEQDTLRIDSTNDSINIFHKINHQCGLDISIEQSIKEAQIVVIEALSGEGAKCMCESEISAKIYPLDKGIYNLKIYEKFKDDSPGLVKESTVAVGNINITI